MPTSSLPTIAAHPVDHDAIRAYYAARGMREREHFVIHPGPQRWVNFDEQEDRYDRYAGL